MFTIHINNLQKHHIDHQWQRYEQWGSYSARATPDVDRCVHAFIVFFNDRGGDPHALTDVLTSYILFCEETVTHTKQITIHQNN